MVELLTWQGVVNTNFQKLVESCRWLRERILNHPVYSHLNRMQSIHILMEHHVFAVWDFMALVKSLQNALTCTSVTWVPQGDPTVRRLINEITVDEESDEDGKGGYVSHFELYVEAMKQCGADTKYISEFITRIRRGEDVLMALENSGAPQAAKIFVGNTWQIICSGVPHQIAAAFTMTRETIVPNIFQVIIGNIQKHFPTQMSQFSRYLERHIHIDKDRHAAIAIRMLEGLCEEDERKWLEAGKAAQTTLKARIGLWDGVEQQILKVAL